MNIRYDKEVDAMYITLRKAPVANTKKVDDNTVIDYDENGRVIGIELLFVTEHNPDILKEFLVEQSA